VKLLDDQVGDLLDTIERCGGLDNTYIVFSADHGEMLGDHGRWTKGVHYEASLRIPMMISGPGITPGKSDTIVELNDLNPTFCELAGTRPARTVDAKSLLPTLNGETQDHREYSVSTHEGHSCIRTDKWKLIAGTEGEDELYDLANDPEERRNVIADHPSVSNELKVTLIETLRNDDWWNIAD